MMKEFKALWKGRLASCLTIVAVALLVSASSALAAETFDSEAAEEEGYWYSRYNMGTLAMRSGLGETFMPDMEMMMQAMKMADADFDPMQKGMDYGDGDHPMPPVNPSLLQVVYKSGSPYYTQPVDINDFATQKWDPATFDKTVTGLATGHLMIKEIEWGKGFLMLTSILGYPPTVLEPSGDLLAAY